jgi:hypothetical protein
MEKIKISIDVNVDLSENMQNFVRSLFCGSVAPAPAPAPAPTVTIEQVRLAVSEKVNDHRAEIKAKLMEFGVPNVTKLAPENYEEMLNFLNNL